LKESLFVFILSGVSGAGIRFWPTDSLLNIRRLVRKAEEQMTIMAAARKPPRKKRKAPALRDEMAASRDVKNRVRITLHGGKCGKKTYHSR